MPATTVGGYLLAGSGKAAIDAGDDDPFYADKLATMRFYASNILPTVNGMLDPVTAGADDLYAIDAARLQSACGVGGRRPITAPARPAGRCAWVLDSTT